MTILSRSKRTSTGVLYSLLAVAVMLCTGCPEAVPDLTPIGRDPNNGIDDPITDTGAQDRPDDVPSMPDSGNDSGDSTSDPGDSSGSGSGNSSGGSSGDITLDDVLGQSQIDRDVKEFGDVTPIDSVGHIAEFATGQFLRTSAGEGEPQEVRSNCWLAEDNIGEVLLCEWYRPDSGAAGAEGFDIIRRIGDDLFLEQDIYGIISQVRIRRVNDDNIEFWRTVNTTGDEILIWTGERMEFE